MLDDGLEERRTRAVKVEFQDWMDAAQTCLRRALYVAHECDGADPDRVLDILNRVALAKCSVVVSGTVRLSAPRTRRSDTSPPRPSPRNGPP